MSAATDTAASAAAAGATGIDGGAGEAQTAADSGRGPTDYIQQVRTNPDFAEREVRNLKSRFDSSDAELRKMREQLGSLSPYLDQGVTGDQIATYVHEYAAINNDPELVKMIQDHRAGGAKGSSTNSSSDEYLTPEEEKIRELEGQLRGLQQRVTRQESSFGVSHLRSNLTAVASEIGLTPEINKRVMGDIEKDIQVWSQNHAKGDPAALSALQQLQGDNSRGFIRTMIMNKLDQSTDFEEIARHRQIRKQGNARRFETDGPSEVATTGQEPPPDFSQFKSAAEAARWARDNPDRHDSY